jgi:hypothetical protein
VGSIFPPETRPRISMISVRASRIRNARRIEWTEFHSTGGQRVAR